MSKSSTQNPQFPANSNLNPNPNSSPRFPIPSESIEEKVANWILEFFLRKPIDEKIINGALSSLPLSNKDNRLKKTLLLRRIESETSNGSVSEKLLELLEILEELIYREGKMASNLLKKAYCAVAVDCTVRFLEEDVEENGKYSEAVERVWSNRVCKMEGLASEESNRWFADVEAAVWDRDVCERVLMRNTRNEALKAVRLFLKEAWEGMGPPFLEFVALNIGDLMEKLGHGGDGGKVVDSEGMPKGPVPVIRQKHVALKIRRPRGAKIFDADEEAEASMNTVNEVQTGEVDKMQALQSCSGQLHAAVTNSHPDACQAAHNLSPTTDNDVKTHTMDNDVPTHSKNNGVLPLTMDKVQETHQSNSLEMHAAVTGDASQAFHNLSFAKALNIKSSGNAVEKLIGPPVMHGTPEVSRVQNTLRSSTRELHEAVTDPLPEALEIAKTLSSTHNHDTTAVENHNINNDAVLANQTQPVVHEPLESTGKNTENVEQGKHTGDVQGNETCDPKEQKKHKRSLMDPHVTSHTVDWDDSIDSGSGGSSTRIHLPSKSKRSRVDQFEDKKMMLRERKNLRPREKCTSGLHLPLSPERSTVSPLEEFGDKKISLRVRKKWTPYEEDTLRDAVKKFGKNWKLILECYSETFKERTNVDLKDKWRNLIRSQP